MWGQNGAPSRPATTAGAGPSRGGTADSARHAPAGCAAHSRVPKAQSRAEAGLASIRSSHTDQTTEHKPHPRTRIIQHVLRRLPGRVDVHGGQAREHGEPAAHVVAVGVKPLALRGQVDHVAKVMGVCRGCGAPGVGQGAELAIPSSGDPLGTEGLLGPSQQDPVGASPTAAGTFVTPQPYTHLPTHLPGSPRSTASPACRTPGRRPAGHPSNASAPSARAAAGS